MRTNKLIIAIMFAFAGFISAQQMGDYSKDPGYFNFGDITSLKSGDMTTEVYLEGPLLKMLAKMGESKDEEFGKMIQNLKLVKVNEFYVDSKNSNKISGAFSSVDKELQAKKWQRIIKTKHDGTLANVYVKPGANDSFVGLAVTALNDSGKVSIVNIVGTIDLETIGKLSHHFHFPDGRDMKERKKMKDDDDK